MNIILIGAGQLGSRHLQSIANVDIPNVNIEVVDPFQKSLDVTKERYLEVSKGNQAIDFFTSIKDTKNSEYDIAIIATNSNIRALVVKELLSAKVVKNMILEKVLFQKEEEYYEIQSLIDHKKVNTWVNHPRRMFPFYHNIKQELQSSKKIHFSVSVGNWGLACNALHLLDLFQYIIEQKVRKIDLSYLEEHVYDAKRKGFCEINGMLLGSMTNGSTFQVTHIMEEAPLTFSISSDICNVYFNEKSGLTIISKKSEEWKPEIKSQKITYFQSELSEIFIKDIYYNHKSDLPNYNEAMELHLLFINKVQKHINKFSSNKYNLCPIT